MLVAVEKLLEMGWQYRKDLSLEYHWQADPSGVHPVAFAIVVHEAFRLPDSLWELWTVNTKERVMLPVAPKTMGQLRQLVAVLRGDL